MNCIGQHADCERCEKIRMDRVMAEQFRDFKFLIQAGIDTHSAEQTWPERENL